MVVAEWLAGAHLLIDHPSRGGLLGVPGLEQLLGNAAQFISVSSGINGTTEPFDFKLLAHGQSDWHRHRMRPVIDLHNVSTELQLVVTVTTKPRPCQCFML